MQALCRPSRGFTLVELLSVLLVVSVLLTVAWPAYRENLIRGRRSDAVTALLDGASRQELYRLQRARYTTNLAELGYPSSSPLSSQGHYRLRARPCEGGDIRSCYELAAIPAVGSAQLADRQCGSLLLDSRGRRTATGVGGSGCW